MVVVDEVVASLGRFPARRRSGREKEVERREARMVELFDGLFDCKEARRREKDEDQRAETKAKEK